MVDQEVIQSVPSHKVYVKISLKEQTNLRHLKNRKFILSIWSSVKVYVLLAKGLTIRKLFLSTSTMNKSVGSVYGDTFV